MKTNVKKILGLFICTVAGSSLFAANGVCFHCEEIRENNRLHPHNYEYYDDYLEEQHKGADETKTPEDKKVSPKKGVSANRSN